MNSAGFSAGNATAAASNYESLCTAPARAELDGTMELDRTAGGSLTPRSSARLSCGGQHDQPLMRDHSPFGTRPEGSIPLDWGERVLAASRRQRPMLSQRGSSSSTSGRRPLTICPPPVAFYGDSPEIVRLPDSPISRDSRLSEAEVAEARVSETLKRPEARRSRRLSTPILRGAARISITTWAANAAPPQQAGGGEETDLSD